MGHIISKLIVENFRSIVSQEFEFAEFTPVIGYNNAGKSNILEAIKWVLRKYSLGTSNFNDPLSSVIISAVIDGINDAVLERIAVNHRTSITPFLDNEKLTIRRIQVLPHQGVAQISLYILKPGTDNDWQLNPTGIDNAIKDLFPEPIHIGAMENSEDDVTKSTSTSTIGKLLAEIIGPIEEQYGHQVRETLNSLRKILDADGDERAPELNDFDTSINEKLDSFFPDIKIKVHVPTPELKEVFKKGTIKVFENNSLVSKDVGAMGHGAQRSIQMTLVRHLADLKMNKQYVLTTTLLLIDEPELYLHPQAIEILRHSLKLLSKEGYQVIFTTHSPFMITQYDMKNTLLIKKDHNGTFRTDTLREAVESVEQTAKSQMELLFNLSNSSYILFSDRVILAEGKTENRLIPLLIEKVTSKSVSLHKCALVEQGGSGNTMKSLMVLGAMGIPAKAIVDLDFALKEGVKNGFFDEDNDDIKLCKEELQIMSEEDGNIFIGTDGWPAKDKTNQDSYSASKSFALLASRESVSENIDRLLRQIKARNIWVWRNGTIENHLDIEGKSELVWAAYANRLETEELVNIIPNGYENIVQCINWLID